MDAEKRLEALKLCCIRQQKVLFHDMSFRLEMGEALVIEGPNGGGKSSLLRLLTGLSSPHEGEIRWQDESIQRLGARFASDLHYIAHSNGTKLGLSVTENLQLIMRMNQKPISPLNEVLTLLKLTDYQHTLSKELSAGLKRRLALARLFLSAKPLWILDEPFTALDAETQALLLAKIENHLASKGICVLSSHQPIPLKNARKLRLG